MNVNVLPVSNFKSLTLKNKTAQRQTEIQTRKKVQLAPAALQGLVFIGSVQDSCVRLAVMLCEGWKDLHKS